jgi:hypothetical protein
LLRNGCVISRADIRNGDLVEIVPRTREGSGRGQKKRRNQTSFMSKKYFNWVPPRRGGYGPRILGVVLHPGLLRG